MIYCKNCGTEIPEGAKFCVRCGAPVESKSGKNYWLIVLGIIFIISGVITMAGVNFDFTSLGVVVGYATATTIKVAIPVGIIALIVKLIKK